MPEYYPVMLDIRGRKAIVVGGDRVAAEKAASLAASGAQVSALSPTFCHELFCADALAHKIVHDGLCTSLRQNQVVIFGPFVVGVAGDFKF